MTEFLIVVGSTILVIAILKVYQNSLGFYVGTTFIFYDARKNHPQPPQPVAPPIQYDSSVDDPGGYLFDDDDDVTMWIDGLEMEV